MYIYIYRTIIPIILIRRNEVFRDIDWHFNCCLSSFYLGDMWNDRRHLVFSMFHQLLDPCAHRHRVNRSTPSKFNISPEKWWLEDYFPFGMVKNSGAILNIGGVWSKPQKQSTALEGWKIFALVGPLQFPGAFCCWAAARFWKDPEMMELKLILLLNSRGFTNWYLKVCCFFNNHIFWRRLQWKIDKHIFFQLAQAPKWSSPLRQLEPVGSR